jgi:hypothetical protein
VAALSAALSLGWMTAPAAQAAPIVQQAVPQATKITLKFDPNGGTVSKKSKSVKVGAKYGTLPTPIRQWYSFQGWYTKKSGGVRMTSASVVTTAKKLYAHWKLTNTITLRPGVTHKVKLDGKKTSKVKFDPGEDEVGYLTVNGKKIKTVVAGDGSWPETTLIRVNSKTVLYYEHWCISEVGCSYPEVWGSLTAKKAKRLAKLTFPSITGDDIFAAGSEVVWASGGKFAVKYSWVGYDPEVNYTRTRTYKYSGGKIKLVSTGSIVKG